MPLHIPRHFIPDPSMTDEELLQIAGLTDLSQLAAMEGSDPAMGLGQHGLRPVPDLGVSLPHIPLSPRDQIELDERLPEADFVPEAVSDPAAREAHRTRIQSRLAKTQHHAKREGQWGGQAPGLLPGGSAMLLDWRGETHDPLAMNVQLSYTIDAPTNNIADPAAQKGMIGPTIFNFTPSPTDDIGLYARIEWGSGRAQHLAIVDFQGGAMVRITGSWVRVTALYLPTNLPQTSQASGGGGWPAAPDQLFGPGVPVTGPPVTASAMLGKGFPTFTTAAARFTRKAVISPAGVPGPLLNDPIPPFASAFGYATSSPTGAPLILTMSTNLLEGGTGLININSNAIFLPDNAIPIPVGARFLTVQTGGVAPVGLQIFYALML